MSVLSDSIESFILSLMQGDVSVLEVQRNELAQHFGCAPSHINYVLSTRFTLDRGYTVNSRRGGGGYIRIVRIDVDRDSYLYALCTERIGDRLSKREAAAIISSLRLNKLISAREALLMSAALSDKAIGLVKSYSDPLRAAILRQQILTLINHE